MLSCAVPNKRYLRMELRSLPLERQTASGNQIMTSDTLQLERVHWNLLIHCPGGKVLVSTETSITDRKPNKNLAVFNTTDDTAGGMLSLQLPFIDSNAM